MKPKKVSASLFKAECLQMMDNINKTKTYLIITKRGEPVAEVHPIRKQTRESYFGFMAESLEINGDIIDPIDSDWDALKDEK